MSTVIVRSDAASLPLPDGSVDLVVTSPPYFGLRSYTDGGEHYAGQIGSEATPREYLAAMLACTREWMRVLKPEGSLFVNLGDKYSQYEGARKGHGRNLASPERTGRGEPLAMPVSAPSQWGIAPKSLMGMPWRYAIGCIDDLGLILRAEIVWAKPNGLPESVTDRVRRAHEQVFHFTKQPRYYSAVDEVREATADIGRKPKAVKSGPLIGSHGSAGQDGNGMRMTEVYNNPLGKLPGSVWEIPSQPLAVPAHLGVDHFAAFPMELPRRIILGWSPPGVCTACGQGRRPVSVAEQELLHTQRRKRGLADLARPFGEGAGSLGPGTVMPVTRRLTTITGYACACPDATAPVRPAVVLDPFGGTGTTALVASVLGRQGVSADRSADYCRLASWRVSDPGERARAMQVPKPPAVPENQMELFDIW